MTTRQKILVIIGPTSSGKSALAIELARKFNGEVISADSRQVYKGLNIGTGKITKKEMGSVRHHLLDVAWPKKIFTAQNFVVQGRKAIADIAARGKLPIVAGGTGFYIDTLLGRIALPDVPPNQELRAKLEQKTIKQLFALLKSKDPRRARSIDSHNKRRLIRALEIVSALGKVPNNDLRGRYSILWIGLSAPIKILEKEILIRLRVRIRGGMVGEARWLHKAGLTYRRMEQLGLEYRALARHLQGKISHDQMVHELNHNIRRYAKRQLTYWKRNRSIHWFNPMRREKICKLVGMWLRTSGR
ncbi:tRNA (adenosine(37)-N6)-dimethylallyltransferase MiaA [Candidatus Kaiserbacteria bacterium]|nr:tRNA (adenosine(37)-N6)-dimethylallyltransferase MiaA [Candidatus Kaiserbacteria bacterium]